MEGLPGQFRPVADRLLIKIPLPLDAVLLGLGLFPIADNLAHLSVWRKKQQGVYMVRHQQKQVAIPTRNTVMEPG